MECPSCYEYFDGETRVPRNLNCGHTFCEMCLVKIEQQRLTFCPLCKTTLQKPFKAKKLPKNYLALEYASKHHEMMKNSNFCQSHPKELMRHFCITCVSLICMECIVDHSGHEFVRKDESVYILKENGAKIVNNLDSLSRRAEFLISQGNNLRSDVKKRKVEVMTQIDENFDRIIHSILQKRAEVKLKYAEALQVEEARIMRDQENFDKHLSLIRFCKENVQKTCTEIDNFRGKQIKGSDLANRVENFKNQEETLTQQTNALQPINMTYPQVEFNTSKLLSSIKDMANVHHRTVKMTHKKLCFFGDTNKVIVLDLHDESWVIKTINKPNYEFLYYAAAVTLPNGDALITGGGSSQTVFQFLTQKNDLVQKRNMNQMRKEHAAVIADYSVFVMGGYDGVQNVFLNCCEVYNVKKDEWRFFASMNISKCAFSATVVNNRFIYTFGGYDGQNRLDAIERYSIADGDWLLLKIKLKLPLSNCACFCPEPDKVVVFGGGFSSGFSPYVEQIDIKTGVWKTLPVMNEGRDLRNKVCFIDDHAYAVGGLNSKAEKFSFKEKKWVPIPEYPLSDNLDSWASALCYVPQEYSNLSIRNKASLSSGIQEESKEFEKLLEKEKAIDAEIKQEIEKYKNKQKKAQASGQSSMFNNEDFIEVIDPNAHAQYISSEEDLLEDDEGRNRLDDKDDGGQQFLEIQGNCDEPPLAARRHQAVNPKAGSGSQRLQMGSNQVRVNPSQQPSNPNSQSSGNGAAKQSSSLSSSIGQQQQNMQALDRELAHQMMMSDDSSLSSAVASSGNSNMQNMQHSAGSSNPPTVNQNPTSGNTGSAQFSGFSPDRNSNR